MENATAELREVCYECRKEELEMDKFQAIEKLDANIESYLERYETLKKPKMKQSQELDMPQCRK